MEVGVEGVFLAVFYLVGGGEYRVYAFFLEI